MISDLEQLCSINETKSSSENQMHVVRNRIESLGSGAPSKISRIAGVDKTKISRFMAGKEILASSYLRIADASSKLAENLNKNQESRE